MMLDQTPENAWPIHLRLNGGEVGIVVSCNVSGLEAFNPNRYRRGVAALPFQGPPQSLSLIRQRAEERYKKQCDWHLMVALSFTS
jgi:hypothetical protein